MLVNEREKLIGEQNKTTCEKSHNLQKHELLQLWEIVSIEVLYHVIFLRLAGRQAGRALRDFQGMKVK